ncbi:hypothetical protein ABZP36_015597 [Zizania latifolia]
MAGASPLVQLFTVLLVVAATTTTTVALTDDVLALVVFKLAWPTHSAASPRGPRTTTALAPGWGRLPRALLRLDALLSLSLLRNNLSIPVLPNLIAALPRLCSLDLSSNQLAALSPPNSSPNVGPSARSRSPIREGRCAEGRRAGRRWG